MTDKLFDSFIKQKLEAFESPVPDALWDKIMPEEKRKPKAFWWWNKTAILIATAIAVATGVGTATYFAASKNNIGNNNNKTKTENKTLIVANNDDIKSNKIEKNSIQNNDASPLINTKEEKKNTVLVANKKDEVATHFTTKSSLKNKEKKNIASNNSSKIETVIENKKTTNSLSLLSYKENDFAKTTKSTSLFNSKKVSKKLNLKNIFDENNAINNDLILTQKQKNDFNIVARNSSLLELNSNNKLALINLGNLFGKNQDCPTTKGSPRNDFYIEAYASPDYTFKKTISATSGLDAYLTQKDSVEVMRGGFTIGARISKSITNNLLLKAGIQYSQVNEQFSIKTENERRQTIIINSHTIVRAGQSDTTISDTSTYVQVGYRVQSNMNYYRSFELPILLSYEIGDADDKWKFAFNGGAIINLTSWREGRTIDTAHNLVSINSKANNSYYKQQIGLSLYASASIFYKINENVDVFVEPYYRLGISKLESIEGFKQKFNALGLQVGARIKLNKNKKY